MTAYALTQDARLSWPAKIEQEDVSILSISLDWPREDLRGMDRGCLRLLPNPLLNMLLTGNSGPAEQQAYRLFGDRVRFLKYTLPNELGEKEIDDYSAVGELQSWANQTDLSADVAWLQQNGW